jgi:prepilin-type processing-associated H-X9-DG protein/prepilin-type N-terminal cleavage/methylation domain-containing protein
MRPQGCRPSAFTLIELMVVMAIIMILASLILTTAWNSRQKALQTYCLNNIRSLALGEIGQLSAGSTYAKGECPAGCQYARNARLTNAQSVSNPSRTVLYFESEHGGSGTEADVVKRHLGGANFAFCDGHAKWSKETPSFGP